MDEPSIEEWLDRHHVEIVRTHATNLDGLAIGKYINRPKFLKSLEPGHGIADVALAMDLSGLPHMTFWHEFRHAQFGDIMMKPDLDTIISDGTDPDLGHCICDFVRVDGSEISLCPRTLLRNMTSQVSNLGYTVKASFELEFFVFDMTYSEARRRAYEDFDHIGASELQTIYLLRNAYHAKPLMDEVTKRLSWQGFKWESWSDENGLGQVELNFAPASPVTAADTIARARQIIYEVAVDMDKCVTFMAHPMRGYSSGLHVHHSLLRGDEPAFFDRSGTPELLANWIAGIIETMPAATSFLCPTINSYRRMREFTSPPVTATWGEENRSAALRLFTQSPAAARIEHRLPASDANPYLALAVILAGGIVGLKHNLSPPEELTYVGWALPREYERLPNTIGKAADVLAADGYLKEILGQDVIDYWVNSRRMEWLSFHTEGGDPATRRTTPWEYKRYFELM